MGFQGFCVPGELHFPGDPLDAAETRPELFGYVPVVKTLDTQSEDLECALIDALHHIDESFEPGSQRLHGRFIVRALKPSVHARNCRAATMPVQGLPNQSG